MHRVWGGKGLPPKQDKALGADEQDCNLGMGEAGQQWLTLLFGNAPESFSWASSEASTMIGFGGGGPAALALASSWVEDSGTGVFMHMA